MGTLVICVVSASQSEGKGSRRLNQFAVARFRKGHYRQAEQLFDFIRQRPELQLDSTEFYYGVLLVATDRAKEARYVLSQFIQESERFLSEEPQLGGDRKRGERLRMTGYSQCVAGSPEVAESYFALAVEFDRARLAAVMGTSKEADARSLLSSSLLAMGMTSSAADQHRQAFEEAPGRFARRRFRARRKLARALFRLVDCNGV